MKLPGYEAEVVEALHRHGLAGRSLISTMEPSSIDLLREIAPEIPVGRSFPRVRRDPTSHPLKRWPAYALVAWYRRRLPAIAASDIRRGRIDALMCHWAFVTQRLVDRVTGAGGELYVWTVDDARQIARLEAMGVTGVISNDPRLFRAP
jgi:glycerophosphoryl diester phosphodiesterase